VIWSDEPSFTLLPVSGRVYVWRTPKGAYNLECLVPTVKHGGGSVMVSTAISWSSAGSFITIHGPITVREYVESWVVSGIPWSRCYFRTRVQFFKTTIPSSHSWNSLVMVWRAWMWTSTSSLTSTVTRFKHHWTTLVSLGDWSEEQIPTCNISKQLEDALQEEWYKIPLETVRNLYESIPRGLRLYWRQKLIQHHVNKEMCVVSVVFPLFCGTPAYHSSLLLVLSFFLLVS
jgi:hypothetical protein